MTTLASLPELGLRDAVCGVLTGAVLARLDGRHTVVQLASPVGLVGSFFATWRARASSARVRAVPRRAAVAAAASQSVWQPASAERCQGVLYMLVRVWVPFSS